ncbi:MAG: putative holin-like toxin [Firmicutes bacterium]|nr:putative holin-like toxin [Bacillota bacterium]
MSTYEALSLMIVFGMFIVSIISYLDRDRKK